MQICKYKQSPMRTGACDRRSDIPLPFVEAFHTIFLTYIVDQTVLLSLCAGRSVCALPSRLVAVVAGYQLARLPVAYWLPIPI